MDVQLEIRLPPDPRFAPVAGAALSELANMNGGPGAEMERLAPLLTEAIASLQAGSTSIPGGVCLVLRILAGPSRFQAEVTTEPPDGQRPSPPRKLLARLRKVFDRVEVSPQGGWLKVERAIPA